MPVVISDRDAEKIVAELRRHRFGVAALADDAYRDQWLQMIDRLIEKLGQRVQSASKQVLDDHNERLISQMRGVPAEIGTAETDADPRNPNAT